MCIQDLTLSDTYVSIQLTLYPLFSYKHIIIIIITTTTSTTIIIIIIYSCIPETNYVCRVYSVAANL